MCQSKHNNIIPAGTSFHGHQDEYAAGYSKAGIGPITTGGGRCLQNCLKFRHCNINVTNPSHTRHTFISDITVIIVKIELGYDFYSEVIGEGQRVLRSA